jgi:hypothetical protein
MLSFPLYIWLRGESIFKLELTQIHDYDGVQIKYKHKYFTVHRIQTVNIAVLD